MPDIIICYLCKCTYTTIYFTIKISLILIDHLLMHNFGHFIEHSLLSQP